MPRLTTEHLGLLYDAGVFELDSWNDRRLVLGCDDGVYRLFDLSASGFEPAGNFAVDYGGKYVAFSPDGRRVLGTDTGSIRVWTDTGELLALVRHPRNGWFFSAEFTDDGRSIVTVDTMWTVQVWPIEDADVLGPAREVARGLRPKGFTEAERQRFAELLR